MFGGGGRRNAEAIEKKVDENCRVCKQLFLILLKTFAKEFCFRFERAGCARGSGARLLWDGGLEWRGWFDGRPGCARSD